MDEMKLKSVLPADEVEDLLRESFYRSSAPSSERRRRVKSPRKRPKRAAKPKKAEHYEVICISLYNEDLARLDEKVKSLKAKGHRKMNRSALIRYALDTADLDGLPRAY